MSDRLSKLYFGGCCPHVHDLADSEQLFSDDELDAFIQNVWKSGYKNGKLDRKRVSKYAGKLFEGVEKGYGKSLATVDYDTPDHKMLSALADNVFHFSAAKNRAEIEALSAAMRGEDGKPVSFAEFKKRASEITGEFQGHWLKAEYDLAINASTMAARWVEHSADPNAILIYRTAGDGRVRQSHKQLNGISRPVNDKFWDTYYPPNGWNCRCDVEKTLSGRVTGDDQLPHGAIDDVPPMFRSNLAKEGMAFPPDHPYFILCTQYRKQLADGEKAKCGDKLGMSHADADYKLVRTYENGGKVSISAQPIRPSKLHDKRAVVDHAHNVTAANAIAKEWGMAVHINPDFENQYDWRYNSFFMHSPISGKMPDLRINRIFYEVESYEAKYDPDHFTNWLKRGKRQSPNVVIVLKDEADIENLKKRAIGYRKKNNQQKNASPIHDIIIVDANGKPHRV